jgi:uncharacterized protein with beta-barrel porin domain
VAAGFEISSGGGLGAHRLRLASRWLASSSMAALLIGGGTPAAFAACNTSYTNTTAPGCTNAAVITGIGINNSTITGTINNTGVITPNGIALTNGSTIAGSIVDSGTIGGGIVIDRTSTIDAGVSGIAPPAIVILGATFTGGISNAGTLSSSNEVITVSHLTGSFSTVSTFSGGISNSGTITSGSGFGIIIDNTISFSGGITNSGRISSQRTGISVQGVTSFAGGISNSGTIASNEVGILIGGGPPSTGTFTGGIANSGTISAGGAGIEVVVVSIFAGGIRNSGLISGSTYGISVSSTSSFSGGISNSGTITAEFGISVSDISNFSGGISNSGTIAGVGFGFGFGSQGVITVARVSTFSGGIANSGTISASGTAAGIEVLSVTTFLGGISNSGVISAAGRGILVLGSIGTSLSVVISTFSGGIANSGTISAGGDGIAVSAGIVPGFFNGGTQGAIQVFATFAGGISNSGTISAGGNGIFVGGTGAGVNFAHEFLTYAGGISNSGTISAGGNGIFVGGKGLFSSSSVVTISNFSGGISNSGTISAGGNGIFVGGKVGSTAGLTVTISTFAGGISNSGTILAGNSGVGIYVLSVSSFIGGITNSGMISVGANGAGIVLGATSFYGNVSNSGTITGGHTGIDICNCATFVGGAIVNSGIINASTNAINASAATAPVTIDQNAGAMIGNILLSANADVLNINGGTISGNIVGQGVSNTVNFQLGSGTTYTDNNSFTGINQVNINSGTVVLNGANTATHVDVFGTLAGTGSIDPTTVTIHSGGTLSPGSSTAPLGTFGITGTLVFNAGSSYATTIATGAGNNSKTAVTGSATLGGNGTVVVTPQLGHYNAAVYQILTTTTGLTGQFAGLTIHGAFTGTMALDYTTNPGDVDLDVGSGFGLFALPGGANPNQQNVLNGLNNAILGGATIPPGFANLTNLSGPGFLNALTQLSGEAATAAGKGAAQLMNDFLNLMLDPTASGGGVGTGGAPGFAPERDASLPPEVAQAYARALRAKSATAPGPVSFDQRWSAWGSAFGGTSKTDGDPSVGSNNVSTGYYGFAAGLDYRVTPATVVGLSFAGGGTNWNLAQGLGSGRSDAFQAGVYAKTHFGAAYLSGAVAFANHWFDTNRTALGDRLTGSFTGQSYAARLEGGYRLAAPIPGAIIGITPYAAAQVQYFHTADYSETDLTGGGFALSYGAMNATDTRSELGARFDNLQVVDGMPLILRGRLAWAHDWVSNPSLGAVFQALPGSNFTVNGARPPADSALATAAAELHMTASWSLVGKFDGEFASGARTYAGTGTLRYMW